MPPHQYTSRDLEVQTGMSVQGKAATPESSPNVGSVSLALPIVAPIIVGFILIMAVLLMPKGFFLNLASKIGIKSRQNGESSRRWFGQHSPGESVANEKSESTFIECHLATLRAWQKPKNQSQPPLPLHLAKSDAASQPRRPTGMGFQEWQGRQRNATVRSNPMHKFKLTGVGVQSPTYWKKVGEKMEASKSLWEKVKDNLRM